MQYNCHSNTKSTDQAYQHVKIVPYTIEQQVVGLPNKVCDKPYIFVPIWTYV